MKITRLDVKNFRHVDNQIIQFGDKLTVITGQNGTGKSSLLGWVAQACNFKENHKTITGKKFRSEYSEIFRFCKKNDFANKYSIELIYKDDSTQEKKKVMSTRYEKTEKRYRVDFDGRGTALDFPVIYLGLKRLIPLATEKTFQQRIFNLKKMKSSVFQAYLKRY